MNDAYWHHVGFTWSGISGDWILCIDGVLWGSRTNIFKGRKIPSGGTLSIGKKINNAVVHHLVGKITRVNLWSEAKSGSEIEEMAKTPGCRDGDLIAWFRLKKFVLDAKIIRPSMAAFSGWIRFDALNQPT